MRFDFSVGMGRTLTLDEVATHAQVAEECGFKQMTLIDSQNLCRDVYSMMTVAAVNTHRIHIGHGVTNPFTRHPSVTANGTATINELSGGRAFLGIGAGFSSVMTMGMKARSMEEFRNVIEFFKGYTAGKEVEYDGALMHSEWSRRQIPVYMATVGPRSLRMTGELAEGAILIGVNPTILKWSLEVMEKGAEKAGRSLDDIDKWARTMIYVAPSKEAARREVASYAATCACEMYRSLLRRETPEVEDLRNRMEEVQPGIVEEIKAVYDAFEPYEHERTDATHSAAVSQRVIDTFMLTGTPDDIGEEIEKLHPLGIDNVSTVLFSIIDKKGMMREISDKVMPYFRN